MQVGSVAGGDEAGCYGGGGQGTLAGYVRRSAGGSRDGGNEAGCLWEDRKLAGRNWSWRRGGGRTSCGATYSACWLAAQVLCHRQADTSCECED